MIYIPVLKNRQEEMKILKDKPYYFHNNIIPLIEIVQCNSKKDFNQTIENISNLMIGKQLFIELFKREAATNFPLVLEFKRNSVYFKALHMVGDYDNVIPVISFDFALDFNYNEIESFVNLYREKHPEKSLCFRVSVNALDLNKHYFETFLKENDYIMLDIAENSLSSQLIEIDEFNSIKTNAKRVLINSPRKSDLSNKTFDNRAPSSLISNSVQRNFHKYGFIGYGDYCGSRSALPKEMNTNKGCALALFYEYEKCEFYSFVNSSSSIGIDGYHQVIDDVIDFKSLLDSNNDCPVFKAVEEKKRDGHYRNRAIWSGYMLWRYLDQVNRDSRFSK